MAHQTPQSHPTKRHGEATVSRSERPTVLDPRRAGFAVGLATHAHPKRGGNANEDAFLINARTETFAVFDGVGGSADGRLAAFVAQRTIAACAEQERRARQSSRAPPRTTDAIAQHLRAAVLMAHDRIIRAGARWGHPRGIGSTCAIVRLLRTQRTGVPNAAILAHVGDSRVYRYREGTLERLTVDHSGIEHLIAREELPIDSDQFGSPTVDAQLRETHLQLPELIRASRNEITQYLGWRDHEPSIRIVDVARGDVLLLCTDGIHDNLFDEEIANELRDARGSVKATATVLVESSHARSLSNHPRAKPDDATAIVLAMHSKH